MALKTVLPERTRGRSRRKEVTKHVINPSRGQLPATPRKTLRKSEHLSNHYLFAVIPS